MSVTFTALKLVSSDGVTLDLLDGTKWGLVGGGWLPSPPPLRAGLLGAPGWVEDMDDEMTLQVRGTGTASTEARYDNAAHLARLADTQAKFMANLLALWTMMDKVARFGRGDPAAPSVVLQVCIAGSTVATSSVPDQVLLLGAPGLDPTQSTFVMAKSGLNATLGADNYGEVTLQFRRRGAFTPGATTLTAGTAATAASSLVTQAGMAAVAVPSPTYVQIVNWGPSTTPILPETTVIVGEANAFVVLDAQGGGTVAKWTSVADSANNARSGFVLRYTPTDTLPITSGLLTFTALLTYVRVAVLAVVRNASASTFRLKATLSGGYAFSTGGSVDTPEILIDASTPYPRVVNLGTAALRGGITRLQWTATAETVAGSPVLDIDVFVVVNVGDETAAVLVIDPLDISRMSPDTAGGVVISPNPLTYPTPTVDITGSGGSMALTVHGDAMILTKGATLIGLLLATGGGAVGSWRFTTQTPAVATLQWYFKRYQSYVLPA